MSEFLSEAWLTEMAAAAGDAPGVAGVNRLVVEQVVTNVPGRGDVVYHVTLAADSVTVASGPAAAADIAFVSGYPTAVALARGEQNAQQALADGGLRLRGRVDSFVGAAEALRALADVFGTVRRETRYEGRR